MNEERKHELIHKLRGEVAALLGLSSLLSEHGLPIERREEYSNYCRETGKTILQILNQFTREIES